MGQLIKSSTKRRKLLKKWGKPGWKLTQRNFYLSKKRRAKAKGSPLGQNFKEYIKKRRGIIGRPVPRKPIVGRPVRELRPGKGVGKLRGSEQLRPKKGSRLLGVQRARNTGARASRRGRNLR